MSELALRRPAWGFLVLRTLVAGVLAWAITLVTLMTASIVDAGGALASRVVGSYGSWPPFGGASAAALLGDAGAVLGLAAGAVAVPAAQRPLVLNEATGSSVTGVPEMQLGDLRPEDRVPGLRLAHLSLRNLGPRDVRVLGVRPARAADGIRILGAREPRDWTPGQAALPLMPSYTLAPGEYGDLRVLFSDPACADRRRRRSVPLDVRFAGGTSRLVMQVPRCR